MYLRSKQRKPKPKLERRYARKDYDYDASSSLSLFWEGYGAPRVTRSLEIDEKRSFKVGGGVGEFDQICMSLGLSRPEDFAIPESAWEVMKVRSSSDVFPRSRIDRTKSPSLEEMEMEEAAQRGYKIEPLFETGVNLYTSRCLKQRLD